MRTVRLPSGEQVPALGLGTWHMGEIARRRADEVAALRLGLELGMRLIDTAEMYADGGAEAIVAEATKGHRDQVFLVSKVYPHNASRRGAVAACERSLRRLETDVIDLYLLHWRGDVPLAETLEAFEALVRAGKIRHWGVSNFDTADMAELRELAGGAACATNQVLYNLTRRGIEWSLLPWCRRHKMPVMAYSPLEQGRLAAKPALREIARRHDAKPLQVALAWVLQRDDVIAIPKAATPEHVRDNLAALDLRLTRDDLAALDRAFAPPAGETPLAML
ncbi:MAG TPA: aldo/keto reductase [Candidatus Sulfotelmatobacter sp.]|nr:aldo/keto reductase [Candidatus Sulfotelmatobacter sp.]